MGPPGTHRVQHPTLLGHSRKAWGGGGAEWGPGGPGVPLTESRPGPCRACGWVEAEPLLMQPCICAHREERLSPARAAKSCLHSLGRAAEP